MIDRPLAAVDRIVERKTEGERDQHNHGGGAPQHGGQAPPTQSALPEVAQPIDVPAVQPISAAVSASDRSSW